MYIAGKRSGIILQWGSNTLTSNTLTVPFPITFPNSFLQVNIGHWNNGTAANSPVSLRSIDTNKTQFTCYCPNVESGATGISWTSIGY